MLRHLGRRRCSSSAFSGSWTLPFRQEPWAIPFAVEFTDALRAFRLRHSADAPRITVRALRPCHVPFYVFQGTLNVNFTGVIGYDDGGESDSCGRVQASEYERREIECPPVSIGADSGNVSAVYAGFAYRRVFVRRALAEGLSESMLQSAVPLTRLSAQPQGTVAEDFEMKPSFAYKERILARLSVRSQPLRQ